MVLKSISTIIKPHLKNFLKKEDYYCKNNGKGGCDDWWIS